MSENYNLNSKFGFNVANPKTGKAPLTPQKVDLKKSVNNILNSVNNYIDKYEDVFNGNVQKEINMYSRQSMIVGMNLKAGDDNIRNFDVNI